jgi:leucyl aminopeptidase
VVDCYYSWLKTIHYQPTTINKIMQITFSKFSMPKKGATVVTVTKGNKLSKTAAELDKKLGGVITTALKTADNFEAKNGQSLMVTSLSSGKLIVVGVEIDAKNPAKSLESLGGKLYSMLNSHKIKQATFAADGLDAAKIALGAKLKSYDFGKYFTKKKADEKPQLASLTIATENPSKAENDYKKESLVADSVFLTRDLVSEPANVLYPESYAAEIKKLSKSGVKVEVLGEAAMKKLGMGSILSVGDGSQRETQMVIMTYNGGKKGAKPLAFVGKGVTFDTGGISIKPSNGMEEMKFDMAGSAAVVGLIKLLAERKAKVNVVGVVGLVENMPSGTATRPGDVVKSMSGQTIEILNTDAEGRLVLADCLWYTQQRFKPEFMINLATLTGAIIVALGSSRAGLFSNDDELAERLFKTGQKTGEELWRLPLGDVYDKQINSDIADMQNIGADREAGSIMGAVFLQRFVNNHKWAHLDIAGTAWTKKGNDVTPKGATAFGVRLLDQLVRDYYE